MDMICIYSKNTIMHGQSYKPGLLSGQVAQHRPAEKFAGMGFSQSGTGHDTAAQLTAGGNTCRLHYCHFLGFTFLRK